MFETSVVLVMGVVFLALFTQSLSGFGLALVSMPLLVSLVGIQTAAPLVAIIALFGEVILLVYYREALNLGVIWRLALASIIGIPVGVLLLRAAPERLVLGLLGFIVAGYALYALFNFRLPRLEGALWAYTAGFLAGILGGAYNTSGPPVIVYGNCRRWPRDSFKSNLQGFFTLNSVAILVSHALAGSFTADVWRLVPFGLSAAVIGIIAGTRLDKRLNPETFRKVVLVLLFFIGVKLFFS
ncbi:MAG: sulfite exporter TauE/SafE family protein [Candidatus Promineifilaceae bacterium]